GLATWEGLAEIAKTYYEWTDGLTPDVPNDGKAFFGRDAFANYMIIGAKQLGAEIFVTENGKMTPQVDKQVMRRLWDNFYVPYISGYYAAYGKFRSDDLRTGDIAAFVGSTSGATYFPAEVTRADGSTYPIEGKVYALPNFADTAPMGVQQGAGMVVTKSVPEREKAAVEFLKWFTAPEQNIRFCGASGYLPVTAAANSQKAIAEGIAALPGGATSVLRESLEKGVAITGSYELYTSAPFAHGSEARKVTENSMQDWAKQDRKTVEEQLAGGTSLADAVAALNTEANFEGWLNSFRNALTAAVAD
ncbi:MAG: extracellular solute-binding protein, partial [Oscillospiraceae bacterium]